MESSLASSVGGVNGTAIAALDTLVKDVDIVPCPGSGMDYRTPKAKLQFTIVVTYSGTMKNGTLLSSGHLSPNTQGVSLAPGQTGQCTSSPCEVTLRSVECAPLYQNSDPEAQLEADQQACIFDGVKFQGYDLTFTEALDSGLEVAHPLKFETKVNEKGFNQSACYKPKDSTVKDVTDAYTVSAKALNHRKGGMDWTVANDYSLAWGAPIAVRLAVSDLPTQAEVQITKLAFNVKPALGAGKDYTLTRDKKMSLMASPSTRYRTDPHFCRYFVSSAASGSRCVLFYDATQPPNRYNSYIGTIASKTDEYYHCAATPGAANEHNMDYLTFSLATWAGQEPAGAVTVTMTVTGIIEACNSTGGLNSTGTDARRRDVRSGGIVEQVVTAKVAYTLNMPDHVHAQPNPFLGTNNANPTSPLVAVVAAGVAAAMAAMM